MPQAQPSHEQTTAQRKDRARSRGHLRSVTPGRVTEAPADQDTQGRHLSRLIQEAGLDNSSLAKLAGVRRESISRVVNDHARLGPRLAERLGPPLGVTVDELVVPPDPQHAAVSRLDRRIRELEEDRDYLLHVIRQLLAHLDTAGVGTPHIPAAPRSTDAFVRARGLTAQDGADLVDVPAGQRRPRLRRHR